MTAHDPIAPGTPAVPGTTGALRASGTTDLVDDLVIGAGLAGASTAWRLAQRGRSVALVERDVAASELGSSHGSARILRYVYDDPFYASMVVRAEAGWTELASAAGAPLIRTTGCLDFGDLRRPAELARVLDEVGVPYELLSRSAARQRFPGIAPDSDEVLFHAKAGVIDAQTATETMVAQARAHGATVREHWPVASVTRDGSGYVAVSEAGERIGAANVIVAAGGFLPGLLGRLGLSSGFIERMPRLEVRQETAFHFPYADAAPGTDVRASDGAGGGSGGADDAAQARPLWPTFIHKRPEILVYSLPGGRDAGHRGQKLAEFNGGPVIPDARAQRRGHVDSAHRERVVEYVRRFVPGLVPEPYAETTCLFTNTPNEDFVIDREDGLTVLSPCSGHGAKFAPLLGELAADLATGASDVPRRFRPSLAGVAA